MKPSILNTEPQLAAAKLSPVTNKVILYEFEKNYQNLIGYCLNKGLFKDQAEDAVQNTVLWLLENKDSLYYGENFSGLIFKHLKYQCLTLFKEKQNLVRGSDHLIDELASTEKNTEQSVFITSLSRDVGPNVAYIWYYRNIKGYPYYKLAKALGCSESKIRCMLDLAKESSLLGGHKRHRSKYALIGSIYRRFKKTERNLFERRGRPPKIKQWTSDNPPSYQHEYDFEKHFTSHVKCRKFIMKDGILVPSY